MTIYSDREISVHDGEPIELYEFVGSYQTYRYTSTDVAISFSGFTFVPLPIKRSAVKVGVHDEDNIEIRIELPITAGLVKDYGFQITPPRLELTIYRMHRGTNYNTDYSVYWKGKVSTLSIDNNKCTISVPSVFSNALQGNIPSVFYQGPCNHVLFDSGCKVSRALNSIVTTVTSISGSAVQVASVGTFPDGAFIGGEIADTSHNDRRMINAHASNLITVNYPFSNLAVGAQVEITGGCNHAYNGDCKLKYNNQINYGGFPFIPSINPFESGL